ncbi:MAG: VWA domain-containing protein [Polyangiaceae bacterium]|nr:VWA domain-containing protein [Polyangiaceae bacterium]
MRRAGVASFTLVALSVGIGPAAQADDFHWSRSEALVEKGHDVTVTLKRDHAEVRVVRTVHNGGDRADQALFYITPGMEAVAVGLRTMAMVDGKPQWFTGELMEAEAAAQKYRELTGIGGYYPKDPALLSWRSQGTLALQVFPCLAKEDKVVEYTLVMPMHYEAGRYKLVMPPMGTDKVVPRGTIVADQGTFLVDGADKSGKLDLSAIESVEQIVEPPGKVAGDLAVVPFAKERALLGYHFDVAPKLSTVPDKARVVVVIDGSHSFGEKRIEGARAAAKAYLSHFDGSDVEAAVIAYSRAPQAVTPGFVSVADATKALESATITPKNGSEMALALERAGELLASAPSSVERRVVVFSDLETRAELDPARVRAALPRGAIVHLADLDAVAGAYLERDDDDEWAKVPRSTGGVLFRVASGSSREEEGTRKQVFEELARPMRLDHVKLGGAGLDGADVPETLSEGDGIEDHRLVKRYVSFVTLSGELWSTHFEKTLEPSESYGRTRAALVFGSELLGDLTEEEMMPLALFGKAVSPVTSYLAIEPGVRPSTEGLEWGGEVGSAFGAGGLGLTGIGEGGGGSGDMTDYASLLKALVTPGLRTCNIAKERVSVSAESTYNEIVAVDVTVADDDSKHSKANCVTEHVWGVRLPAEFADAEHLTTKLAL